MTFSQAPWSIEEGNFDISLFKISRVHIVPQRVGSKIGMKDIECKFVLIVGKFWGSHKAWQREKVMMSFKEMKEINEQ